jgi:hypothetical protein
MSPDRLLWLLVLAIALVVSTASAKQGRTYYTAERIAAAKANLASCEWAKKQFQQIMEQPPPDREYHMEGYVGATRQVKLSDEQIFAMMPPISIPRKWAVDPTSTCPVHGTEIKRYSAFYPWRLDFEKHPYKLICPVGGEMYPSNDFAAGDLTSGPYPDDGKGCVLNGKRYQFINYWTPGSAPPSAHWRKPTC